MLRTAAWVIVSNCFCYLRAYLWAQLRADRAGRRHLPPCFSNGPWFPFPYQAFPSVSPSLYSSPFVWPAFSGAKNFCLVPFRKRKGKRKRGEDKNQCPIVLCSIFHSLRTSDYRVPVCCLCFIGGKVETCSRLYN